MANKGGKKRGMTQSEVVKHFSEKTGMNRDDTKKLFDELHKLATDEVNKSGEFVLPGFGKLVKAERRARQGRNPSTGEMIQIPAKTALKFRVSKTLKEATLPGSPTPRDYPAADEGPSAFPDPPDAAAELAGESTKGNRP